MARGPSTMLLKIGTPASVWPSNNHFQRTALDAAAEPER
jgi:hypothetical protein